MKTTFFLLIPLLLGTTTGFAAPDCKSIYGETRTSPVRAVSDADLNLGSWNKLSNPDEKINLILKTHDLYGEEKDGFPDVMKSYEGLTFDDFTRPDGSIVLFRSISQDYQKGYQGPNFTLKAGISYSLSPKIVLDHYAEMTRKQDQAKFAYSRPSILISIQHWERDGLENPWKISPVPMIYYEIRIPTKKAASENVVGVVDAEDFRKVVQSFDRSVVTLEEFLKRVQPFMRKPTAQP